MNRIVVASANKAEIEWLSNELVEFGRILRTLDSLDLILPTWELVEANVLIILDSASFTDDQFIDIVNKVVLKNNQTIIVYIYTRNDDFDYIKKLKERGVICISSIDLVPGLVEQTLIEATSMVEVDVPVDEIKAEIEAFESLQNEFDNEDNGETPDVSEEIPNDTVGQADFDDHDDPDVVPDGKTNEVIEDNIEDKINNAPVVESKDKPISARTVQPRTIPVPSFPVTVHRKLILVGSCDRGHGSSFLARNIAHVLGRRGGRAALIELPFVQPYHFDRSLMTPGTLQSMTIEEEQAFQDSFFNVPLTVSKGEPVVRDPYVKEGVSYLVPHPDIKINTWSDEMTRKLVSAARQSDLIIFDVGVHWMHPALESIRYEADEFFLVQLAEPARLERLFNPKYTPAKTFQFLLDQKKDISIIINQYFQYPKRKFYYEYFSDPFIKHHYFLPWIEPNIVASSAMNGSDEAKQSDDLESILNTILDRMFSNIGFSSEKGFIQRLKSHFTNIRIRG